MAAEHLQTRRDLATMLTEWTEDKGLPMNVRIEAAVTLQTYGLGEGDAKLDDLAPIPALIGSKRIRDKIAKD